MSEQIDIDININMQNAEEVDELTSKLDAANAEVERLEDALDEAHMNGDDIEADIIADELAEATAEAESLQEQLDELSNTTVEPEVTVDSSDVDDLNEKMESADSTASSLTTSLAGIAGIAGVEQMVATADRINTSWNQLNLTFGGTGVSLDELKLKTSQAADATGMSGSQIRGYFNTMGIAGVQNTDLLSNSFQSLAGQSYQTGLSIDTMEAAVRKMVMSGNAGQMSLQRLGITQEDLAKAMGVTKEEAKDAFAALDQDGRLDAITKAMGDGK